MKKIIVLAFMCSLSFAAAGQDVAAGQPTVTLQDCISRGLENNFSIRMVKNRQQVSDNNASPANAGLLPTVDLSASYGGDFHTSRSTSRSTGITSTEKNAYDGTLDVGVDLNWTVFDGFSVWTNYKQLKLMKEQGELETRLAVEDYVASVITEYYNFIQQKIRLENFRKNMEQTRRRLYDAGIRAPYAATLTYIVDEIGAQVSEGSKIAMLADLTRFKVEGELGDMQAGKIAEGYRTTVLAGRDTLTGVVSGISPLSTDGLISFSVQLDDESAPVLRSGLKCDIYVVYAYRENVLRLPSGTYYKGAGNYDLFVREGDRLVRRRVSLGEANYDYVEVVSGLEPGEQAVISDMSDYAKQPELRIRPSKKK